MTSGNDLEERREHCGQLKPLTCQSTQFHLRAGHALTVHDLRSNRHRSGSVHWETRQNHRPLGGSRHVARNSLKNTFNEPTEELNQYKESQRGHEFGFCGQASCKQQLSNCSQVVTKKHTSRHLSKVVMQNSDTSSVAGFRYKKQVLGWCRRKQKNLINEFTKLRMAHFKAEQISSPNYSLNCSIMLSPNYSIVLPIESCIQVFKVHLALTPTGTSNRVRSYNSASLQHQHVW